MDSILKMSAKEIVLVSAFAKLAEEAFEAEKLIKEHFKNAFGIDNREIEVYKTESCGEYYGSGYLTIDGIFDYHDNWWGGREYSFSCDAEGIYKMFRSCYLRKQKLAELDTEIFDCNIDNIDDFFRDFINSIK